MKGHRDETNLGGRNSPDLVVVRAHEDISNALANVADNPVIEVLGFGVGHARVESCINQAIDALDLVLLGQHRDIVLERVGDPETLVTDV